MPPDSAQKKRTWLKDIRARLFATWPSLTTDLVSNHLYKWMATGKGQMN